MLAWKQRLDPHALAALLDQVAVREVIARHVHVLLAHVAHHDADVADRNLGERHHLHPYEPWVQVPRPRQQYLLLQAAAAAGVHERLTSLEAVMPCDHRARQIAGGNGVAVEDGQDANPIGRHLEHAQVLRHHRFEPLARRGVAREVRRRRNRAR